MGKTLFCVMVNSFSHLPVVANFKLEYNGKPCEQFQLDTFLKAEYENCNIILDEAYNYLESRISQNELNRIMSYILFQSRKKNVTIYLTAQLFSTIDKRYRELSELLVYANKTKKNYVYYIYHHDNTTKILIPFEKAEKFYSCYDTNEVIFERDERLEFRLKEPEEKFKDINDLVSQIRSYYNDMGIIKITRDRVKLFFTINKLPTFLIGDTYTLLNLGNNNTNGKG